MTDDSKAMAAAVEQMDWAIRLFIDHQAYGPAITLAASAAEIVEEALAGASLPWRLRLPFRRRRGRTIEEASRGDLREAAIQHILHALTGLVRHDRSLPSEGPRFLAWLARRQEAAGATEP